MALLKFSLLCLLLHFAGSTAIEETPEDAATLSRILRDLTGHYHPELHGDHAHAHAHSHSHDHASDRTNEVSIVDLINLSPPEQPRVDGGERYNIPPPPPPDHSMQPNGYANCGCVPYGRCAPEVVAYMPKLLKDLKNDVVCGKKYDLCCLEDPWPGPIDHYKPIAPCVPSEYCVHPYGSDPYDIQNYGVIGPCLGLGSVRCLDGKPTGPTTIVVPIYEPPPPPTPAPPTPPPIVYEPPPTQPPTTSIPIVYVEPPTQPPTTPPPVIYEPPPTQPPIVYEPPPTQPPTIYEPPVVDTYQPPAPVETYVPPTPVETYVPPTPVETYEPPAPVETYEPPAPVETYEPPVPVDTYEPPTPVDTYEPPTETYEPPVTDYGVPGEVPSRSYYGYGRRYHPYGGYRSRFGYGGGFGGGYGGFGFRKRFHFSKGFYG